MDWIEEADGVFRGGGVKGLGLAGALLGFAEHPDEADQEVGQRRRRERRRDPRLLPRLRPRRRRHGRPDEEDEVRRFPGLSASGQAHRRRRQPLPPARPRPRRGVPALVRRPARAQDVRVDEERRRDVPPQADRRRRDEQGAARAARRPRALPAHRRRRADRSGSVRDRRRSPHEHVDPVFLRAGPARSRPRVRRGSGRLWRARSERSSRPDRRGDAERKRTHRRQARGELPRAERRAS